MNELDLSSFPALERLFSALPLDQAMPELVPRHSAPEEILKLATEAAAEASTPEVQAGIWLYVDDLDRSHSISQGIHSPTGSFWHAIMHRREGDFWNSKYWWRQVGKHPALLGDPFEFVDLVEADGGANRGDLLGRQRQEWHKLFLWCLNAQ